jgi:NAD(P)-dependent dehydrogenase (short-subunit alcohol dehydrogenase family)
MFMVTLGRMSDQCCLIVGGTNGIGLAAARRFLKEGAKVVVTGRTTESIHAARDVLEGYGSVWSLTAEAADPESLEAAFRSAIPLLGGRLDVLFHVAGISGRRFGDGPLHECSLEGWDAVLDANARGTFITNRLAVQLMREQEPNEHGLRGTVLNTGSVLAHSPSPEFFGTIAYSASKGALRAMTRAAAASYAPFKIRFNLLSPALIETPMSRRATEDLRILTYLASKQPLSGEAGTPDDCAEAALYLCEPASRFLTGVELTVDGGWCVSEGQIPTVAGSSVTALIAEIVEETPETPKSTMEARILSDPEDQT